jgi:hypothetical protein
VVLNQPTENCLRKPILDLHIRYGNQHKWTKCLSARRGLLNIIFQYFYGEARLTRCPFRVTEPRTWRIRRNANTTAASSCLKIYLHSSRQVSTV